MALAPYLNLPQEIESLRTVIDMRTEEIQKLRRQNMDLVKQVTPLLFRFSVSVLLYVHGDHKAYQGRGSRDGHLDFQTMCYMILCSVILTSTETIRTVRDGDPRTAISIFTQLLSGSVILCSVILTSTETIRTIRDGKPRTATSTFTQLLSSLPLLVKCQSDKHAQKLHLLVLNTFVACPRKKQWISV